MPAGSDSGTPPYPIEYIEYQPHSDAELFEIQIAIVVDICEVPDALELAVVETAVLEHGRCLLACEELAAASPRREDVPVRLDFGGFYARRHGRLCLGALGR